jgi:hypothetical protein
MAMLRASMLSAAAGVASRPVAMPKLPISSQRRAVLTQAAAPTQQEALIAKSLAIGSAATTLLAGGNALAATELVSQVSDLGGRSLEGGNGREARGWQTPGLQHCKDSSMAAQRSNACLHVENGVPLESMLELGLAS